MALPISINIGELASFCEEHGIQRLSLFGSILRSDFNAESDVDVLVEFKPDRVPGLFKMVSMEMALARFFENRKVDLRTAADLSRYFRDDVVASARTLYECEN